MSELQLIETTVTRAGQRRRWQRAWKGAWQGFLAAAGLWLLALGLYKLAPIPWKVLPIAGVAGLVLVLVGLLVGWWRRERLLETARWLDQRQHLQERLSTALELGSEPKSGEWGALLVNSERFRPASRTLSLSRCR